MMSLRIALFVSLLTLGFGAPVIAEDLSDDAVCLDCHEGEERAAPSDPNIPQVHNPEGGFFQEDHEGFVCIDCHIGIEDLEHEETPGVGKVDCLECHDEVPTKG